MDRRRRPGGGAGLAAASSGDLVELRCAAPADVAAARLRRRAERGGDPSDADPGIARAMAAAEDPWPGATTLDTVPPPADVLAAALRAVAASAAGA